MEVTKQQSNEDRNWICRKAKIYRKSDQQKYIPSEHKSPKLVVLRKNEFCYDKHVKHAGK